jgi:aspartate/methionine/tyrosine aminotransferase
MARAQELELLGRDIVHFEIGQPDFPTPSHIAAAGMQAILDGKTRYTPPAGLPALRQRIAAAAGEQRGRHFEPDQVVVASGSKPGLFFTTQALVVPGDEVLYPDPGFPTYEAMVRAARAIPVPFPLQGKDRFSLDLDRFDSLFSTRTKLIVLNSPANQTGGILSPAQLEHIARMAQRHDCSVLSDEIYSRLVYDGGRADSIVCQVGMAERTVIVDGFSKTYAMTGWRLGYMIAPLALAGRLELLITHAIGCAAAFTQVAGLAALEAPQDCVAAMVGKYQARRDQMLGMVQAIPGLTVDRSQGAFYLFPDVSAWGLSAQQIASRLINQ